jgi:phosphoribosylanthranilate isomerase
MRPRVKICGIRRLEDALLACELGADAIGFVFWPDSPRFIDPHRARAIVSRLPPFVTPVGVFVNQDADHVSAVAGVAKLGAVQLHGDESLTAYERSPLRVIKALSVTDAFDPEPSLAAIPLRVTVLLDAHDPVRRGGTGRPIDWRVAAAAARIRPIALSGGLNAENVGHAIAEVNPYAIDVSSGVESTPGLKDAAALRRFFEAVDQSTRAAAADHLNPLSLIESREPL